MITRILANSRINCIALLLSLVSILVSYAITGRAFEGSAFRITSAIINMSLQDTTIDKLLESEPDNVLKGQQLKAFLAAYESFTKDRMIPDSKRNIENYEVQFRENNEYYLVLFTIGDKGRARQSARVGGESDLTKSVVYLVSKRDFRIK